MTTTPKTPTFSELPDDARLWIFGASRPLTGEQSDALLRTVDRFLTGWHAHGRAVVGARDLRFDRFLLVSADERASGVSGCSIDSLFRVLQEAERELDLQLLDSSLVYYRGADGRVRAASRAEFRERAGSGELDLETPVFDNTVRTVGELRAGAWEKPVRESWHAKAFFRGG